MLMKMTRSAILMLLALAPLGAKADAAIYCRLKGGSLVPLPAAACAMEGGTPVNAVVTPADSAAVPAAVPAPVPAAAPAPAAAAVKESAAPLPPIGDLNLDQAQKVVVDILDKGLPATARKVPESLERTARFDGCRLVVEEKLHIEFGNLITSLKDFKIDSAVDFRTVGRDAFGSMGKVSSKAGDLGGEAIYFEEPKNKAGNNIGISVAIRIKGDYSKYTTDRSFVALDGPNDDYWIADEYGYPRDTIMGTPARDKIRILYLINSPDDAARLAGALDKVGAMCRAQPGEPGAKKD
ncbi:hypothetical protein MIZ01_1749 [Sideroxyarcus emersonii]|uniref:Uncharacterized protein n=1 Tax=Sideroxyarcus emersonii TaxID=2764705 RepID=A0AAN2BZM5_9PROT|nr:hypothetical protein [Sideroxyarcus emersonii]BCK87952.1 hypothetical protein MIZ01_1749 [Sideroxyarcus emersonii]